MKPTIENITYSNIELVQWILENYGSYDLQDGYPIMIGNQYYAIMNLAKEDSVETITAEDAEKPARKARTNNKAV